ncbi:hypothetical protein SISNIDRAFT_486202 [Sistotremastrum niveocremeum HHB9708]|uniref:DUF6535 domain-containing protein n=1 Tax=Sistotremastrum niveocremeum HHB9708 TaxID=1314777 RepID=A0A164TW20_9AGAM|nr:hypothetical protein SISNIDRAFT_486202 [Sistotremastrum niveocremeum HHB9708]
MTDSDASSFDMTDPDASSGSNPGLINGLMSRFDKLLVLMEHQNTLMESQGRTLEKHSEVLDGQHNTMKKHSSMLEALEKDATKEDERRTDDRAHDLRPLEDEQTWGALDKESLAKIKVVVEGWRDLMQISLVFIALFLTVVTAFISPLIQTFTSPPTDASPSSSSKNPSPSVPLQFVALFYYLALVFSIFNSVLCVLGMQWAGRLIAVPLGKTNLERTLARERRKAIADRYMLPLMGVLFWTLLLAIGFFVLGLLIQFWELAFSFQGPAAILAFGAVVATVLSLIILSIIVVTTIHAALHQNSPFESPLSNALFPLLEWMRHFRGRSGTQHRSARQPDVKDADPDKEEDSDGHMESAGDVMSAIQWRDGDSTEVQALKTYARLVINTNDTEVLERVVPSFDFGKWHPVGATLFAAFTAVHERFLASDTSFRLKETVQKQVLNPNCRSVVKRPEQREPNHGGNALMRWWATQCEAALKRSPDRTREILPYWAFCLSFEEGNEHICRDHVESYEDSILKILDSYGPGCSRQGDRRSIFYVTVRECESFLTHEKSGMLSALAMNARGPSLIVSLIRSPHLCWFEGLVSFFARGQADQTFQKAVETLLVDDLLPDIIWKVCRLLAHLIPDLSPNFNVWLVDFSPLLLLIDSPALLWQHLGTLLYYFNHGAFECLPDPLSARLLWEFCRDVHLENDIADDRFPQATAFYVNYASCFTSNAPQAPLPRLSDEECNELCDNISSLMKPVYHSGKIVVKVGLKVPILKLRHLDEVQREDVTARVLSNMQSGEFVDLILRHSAGDWDDVKDLVLSILQAREGEILSDVKLFCFEWLKPHAKYPIYGIACRCLGLLNHITPLLATDFTLPGDFTLELVLGGLLEQDGSWKNWRMYSDTIMLWLDREYAVDQWLGSLADLELIEQFFQRCVTDTPQMEEWSPDQRTSAETRERAQFYLGEESSLFNWSEESGLEDEEAEHESRISSSQSESASPQAVTPVQLAPKRLSGFSRFAQTLSRVHDRITGAFGRRGGRGSATLADGQDIELDRRSLGDPMRVGRAPPLASSELSTIDTKTILRRGSAGAHFGKWDLAEPDSTTERKPTMSQTTTWLRDVT